MTVICPLAESHVTGFAREAGAAEELVASRKEENVSVGSEYLFAPIAVETLGHLNTSEKRPSTSGGDRVSGPNAAL